MPFSEVSISNPRDFPRDQVEDPPPEAEFEGEGGGGGGMVASPNIVFRREITKEKFKN